MKLIGIQITVWMWIKTSANMSVCKAFKLSNDWDIAGKKPPVLKVKKKKGRQWKGKEFGLAFNKGKLFFEKLSLSFHSYIAKHKLKSVQINSV